MHKTVIERMVCGCKIAGVCGIMGLDTRGAAGKGG